MRTLRWRRRGSLLALAVLVSLAHWGLAELMPPMQLGEGSGDRMPQRIEVAYVRELVPTAPPAAAPVVVKRPRPRPKPAVVAPEPAASAPLSVAEAAPPAEPVPEVQAALPEPPLEPPPEPPFEPQSEPPTKPSHEPPIAPPADTHK